MREDEADRPDVENFGAGALAATVIELCGLARADPKDAVGRCDAVIARFVDGTVDRRHRASSISALRLAVHNRMPRGPAKAHVDARLAESLQGLQREGRFEASSNARAAFSL